MLPVVVYPVKDLDKAKKLFGAFAGVAPYVDSPYYVGYRVDGIEIGLDPNGHAKGLTGPVCYLDTEDAASKLQSLVESGATIVQSPNEVGGGLTVAIAADSDGNAIGVRST